MFDKTAMTFKKFVSECRHDQFRDEIAEKRKEQDKLVHDVDYA
jgi:hypothetical protein